jgi:Uma2 family endonuclease
MFETTTNPVSEYETERHKPMPSLNHSLLQANLITELRSRYKKTYSIASELSLHLADWPSVPDICIFPKASIDLHNDIIAVTTAPLCAIEIIFPTQSLGDMVAKARAYFEHGVKSCWIVLLPLGNIYVFEDRDTYVIYRSNETLHDAVLDIHIPLNEVFE